MLLFVDKNCFVHKIVSYVPLMYDALMKGNASRSVMCKRLESLHDTVVQKRNMLVENTWSSEDAVPPLNLKQLPCFTNCNKPPLKYSYRAHI